MRHAFRLFWTGWLFNVKNLTNQETCSSQGYCDMFIEINKPSGV